MSTMECIVKEESGNHTRGKDARDIRGDTEIIADILAGDSEQYALLVKRYERLVFSITLRALRERAGAEDAAQETFLKAYLHLGAYNPEYRFSTWISRIAQNTCTDMHRKHRETTGIEEAEQMRDSGPSPEDIALDRERSELLRAHVQKLDEMYRAPLMLYHAKGLKYDEIARILDIPMSMVKNRIFRARRMLRTHLSELAV